jgi:hypothetical protein
MHKKNVRLEAITTVARPMLAGLMMLGPVGFFAGVLGFIILAGVNPPPPDPPKPDNN